MALVRECQKCRMSKVIDTHCGYCYDCLDKYPELGGHKPNCRTAILRAKEWAQQIIKLHGMIEEETRACQLSAQKIEALRFALQKIDPCPYCQGQECPKCKGAGYNRITNDLRRTANTPDPPKTC